jgi:hypothetical protein
LEKRAEQVLSGSEGVGGMERKEGEKAKKCMHI